MDSKTAQSPQGIRRLDSPRKVKALRREGPKRGARELAKIIGKLWSHVNMGAIRKYPAVTVGKGRDARITIRKNCTGGLRPIRSVAAHMTRGGQTSSCDTSMSRSSTGGGRWCSCKSLGSSKRYRTPARLTECCRVSFWMVWSFMTSRCEKRRRLVDVRLGTTRPRCSYIISVRGWVSRISDATLMV